jgi:hypothetical protein
MIPFRHVACAEAFSPRRIKQAFSHRRIKKAFLPRRMRRVSTVNRFFAHLYCHYTVNDALREDGAAERRPTRVAGHAANAATGAKRPY